MYIGLFYLFGSFPSTYRRSNHNNPSFLSSSIAAPRAYRTLWGSDISLSSVHNQTMTHPLLQCGEDFLLEDQHDFFFQSMKYDWLDIYKLSIYVYQK